MTIKGIDLDIPEGCFFLGYRGSIAHNMYVPSLDPDSIDDIDLIGGVVAPENCYLGLKSWGSRGTKEIKTKYDCVFYEIKKLISLLLQGNPNVLSLLWLNQEHILHMDESFASLWCNRSWFVGKHIYKPFAGYASSQLARMESSTAELKARGMHPNHKGFFYDRPENLCYLGEKRKRLVLKHGYDTKNAAHLIRLLRMCVEFLENGYLRVYRKKDRTELLNIKKGRYSLEKVKSMAYDLFQEAKDAYENSKLPEGPNYDKVEAWLVHQLKWYFNNN